MEDHPEARSQMPEPEEEENLTQASKQYDAKVGVLAGLNGSAEPMLRDIAGWMNGGDESAARQWLATQISLYGQRIVCDSYAKLKTDLAGNGSQLIARPLQTWVRIAQRMRDEPARTAQSTPTSGGMAGGRARRGQATGATTSKGSSVMGDVSNKFIKPLIALYGDLGTDDMDLVIEVYTKQLEGFADGTLSAAFDHVAGAYMPSKRNPWPAPAFCKKACERVLNDQKAKAPQRPEPQFHGLDCMLFQFR